MMDPLRQYADERLKQLMGDRLAVQRFIPYDDYIYQNAEPWLEGNLRRTRSRGTVQGELMDNRWLDQLLYDWSTP